MAKGKKREEAQKQRRARKAASMRGGGRSRYAKKHPGNTSPAGMWEWREIEG